MHKSQIELINIYVSIILFYLLIDDQIIPLLKSCWFIITDDSLLSLLDMIKKDNHVIMYTWHCSSKMEKKVNNIYLYFICGN